MSTLQSFIDAIESLASTLEFIGSVMLVLGLFYLSLKYSKFTLYILSGLITFFVSLSMAESSSGVAYGLCVLSAYQFIKSIAIAYQSMGKARGWSQFSGLFKSIKDWF